MSDNYEPEQQADDEEQHLDDEGQRFPVPEDVAYHLRRWGRTIDRWATTGDSCVLITEQGRWSATPEDVSEAQERLQRQRPTCLE